jgi:hypothetical protein
MQAFLDGLELDRRFLYEVTAVGECIEYYIETILQEGNLSVQPVTIADSSRLGIRILRSILRSV